MVYIQDTIRIQSVPLAQNPQIRRSPHFSSLVAVCYISPYFCFLLPTAAVFGWSILLTLLDAIRFDQGFVAYFRGCDSLFSQVTSSSLISLWLKIATRPPFLDAMTS